VDAVTDPYRVQGEFFTEAASAAGTGSVQIDESAVDDALTVGNPSQTERGIARGVGESVGVVAGIPKLALETAEFGAGAVEATATGDLDEFGRETISALQGRVAQTGRFATGNPGRFAGQVVGSSLLVGGAIGAAGRLSGPRAATAVDFATQPLEASARSITPRFSTGIGAGRPDGAQQVVGGSEPLGGAGTGSLYDPDAIEQPGGTVTQPGTSTTASVEAESGILSGRSVLPPDVRERLTNRAGVDRLREFGADERGQLQFGDSGRSETDVDQTVPDAPTDYDPSRSEILAESPRDRMSDEIAERSLQQRRELEGEFEAEVEPLGGRNRGPVRDPREPDAPLRERADVDDLGAGTVGGRIDAALRGEVSVTGTGGSDTLTEGAVGADVQPGTGVDIGSQTSPDGFVADAQGGADVAPQAGVETALDSFGAAEVSSEVRSQAAARSGALAEVALDQGSAVELGRRFSERVSAVEESSAAVDNTPRIGTRERVDVGAGARIDVTPGRLDYTTVTANQLAPATNSDLFDAARGEAGIRRPERERGGRAQPASRRRTEDPRRRRGGGEREPDAESDGGQGRGLEYLFDQYTTGIASLASPGARSAASEQISQTANDIEDVLDETGGGR
jgi:hypothetical protein